MLSKWVVIVIPLALFFVLAVALPAGAWVATKELFVADTCPPIVQGTELVLQKPSATLVHQQTLASTDTEAFALDFPTPAQAGALTFAEPDLAQTSAETVTGTQTGFFTANWCYFNLGSLPGIYHLSPDVSTWHPMKSPDPVGSGLMWPYMTPMAATPAGVGGIQFKPYLNETPAVNAGGSLLSTNATAGLLNTSKNATVPKPNRDYKNMTKGDIANASGLERMYRNANLKNTLPQAYKGNTAYPTMIDPYQDPLTPIKPSDYPKVIHDSLEMLNPGQELYTLFWDL